MVKNSKILRKLNKAWKQAKGNPEKFADLMCDDEKDIEFDYVAKGELEDGEKVYYFSGNGTNSFGFKIVISDFRIAEAAFTLDLEYAEAAKDPILYFSAMTGHLFYSKHKSWHDKEIGECFTLARCVNLYFFNKLCKNIILDLDRVQYKIKVREL